MNREFKISSTIAAGVLALVSVPALADIRAGTNELHGYVGMLWGDDLTDTALGDRRPKLDDDVTFGIRWGYNFSNNWGIESSLGYSPNSATRLAGRDIDLDLTMFDLNAMYHFSSSSRVVPYLTGGAGYAWASLDRPIEGMVGEQPVSIRDDNSYTLNAGGGLKYFATDQLVIRLDARYRYFDKLLKSYDDSLNTVEATLGIGWRF